MLDQDIAKVGWGRGGYNVLTLIRAVLARVVLQFSHSPN